MCTCTKLVAVIRNIISKPDAYIGSTMQLSKLIPQEKTLSHGISGFKQDSTLNPFKTYNIDCDAFKKLEQEISKMDNFRLITKHNQQYVNKISVLKNNTNSNNSNKILILIK